MSITTKNGHILTDEMLDDLAAACERGEYPGIPTGEIIVGRPLMFGEQLKTVTFKEPARKILAIDQRASSLGMSRSDYLRELVDKDLKEIN